MHAEINSTRVKQSPAYPSTALFPVTVQSQVLAGDVGVVFPSFDEPAELATGPALSVSEEPRMGSFCFCLLFVVVSARHSKTRARKLA